jgi:hypothetical protein
MYTIVRKQIPVICGPTDAAQNSLADCYSTLFAVYNVLQGNVLGIY